MGRKRRRRRDSFRVLQGVKVALLDKLGAYLCKLGTSVQFSISTRTEEDNRIHHRLRAFALQACGRQCATEYCRKYF